LPGRVHVRDPSPTILSVWYGASMPKLTLSSRP